MLVGVMSSPSVVYSFHQFFSHLLLTNCIISRIWHFTIIVRLTYSSSPQSGYFTNLKLPNPLTHILHVLVFCCVTNINVTELRVGYVGAWGLKYYYRFSVHLRIRIFRGILILKTTAEGFVTDIFMAQSSNLPWFKKVSRVFMFLREPWFNTWDKLQCPAAIIPLLPLFLPWLIGVISGLFPYNFFISGKRDHSDIWLLI